MTICANLVSVGFGSRSSVRALLELFRDEGMVHAWTEEKRLLRSEFTYHATERDALEVSDAIAEMLGS